MNIEARIKIIKDYYKRNGFIKTIKKVKYKTLNFAKNRKIHKENIENYQLWIENNEPKEEELENQRKKVFEYEPKISVVVPMYNTKEIYLKDIVDSLLKQTYKNWELCLADGSPKKLEYIDKYVNQSNKIKYNFLDNNKGISENTNCAIEMATGEYIALLDHDDLLPAFSLFEIVNSINENKDADFFYTDEDKIFEGKRIDPHFKPDYAPDTLMSYNYICHFAIYKKSLIEKIGILNREFDGSQDYDFILRATEKANKIIHIPKILYHWRMNEDSVALNSSVKPYAYEAAKRAIRAHLERIGESAEVEDSETVGIYRLNYKIKGNPKVSIIIDNPDNRHILNRCIKSIFRKTNYDNMEVIIVDSNKESELSKYYKKVQLSNKIKIIMCDKENNNYSKTRDIGVENSNGEYIVFLDTHMEIISDNWIETMLGNCQRNDVGVVGGKILYKNSKIQHVGIILDKANIISYVNKDKDANESGYMARNTIIQNYSAVTGKLLMISRKDYDEVGALDEEFLYEYADVDLCLKVKKMGKVIVLNPLIVANENDARNKSCVCQIDDTRKKENGLKLQKKWSTMYEKCDSYYNPNFRDDIPNMGIKID